jgi:SAM-dependent methyltransferase
MSIKASILRIHFFLSAQIGIDLITLLRSARGAARYLRDLFCFLPQYNGKLELVPCLHDWFEEAGAAKSEYFWQDLLVARKIFAAKPEKHVDIGSRVDGFVAHVASFREIEIFDIRPITSRIPGVIFKQADLMNPTAIEEYCDSLSCLHTLEHFGLGRYGDPIDPKGYESGIRNMARILKSGGALYLSVPVGLERIEFNAQHVFDPNTIVNIAKKNQLVLNGFTVFTHSDGIVEMNLTNETLDAVGKERYSLGIFSFSKK